MVLLLYIQEWNIISDISYLHSTMVLLLLTNAIADMGTLIGFTFHYGSTSIAFCDLFLLLNISFTFHYGSTSIVTPLKILSTVPLFTFHYGSTSIEYDVNCVYEAYTIYIPLWFYFYAYNLCNQYIYNLIYIPLWFYFYFKTQFEIRQLMKHLHSTMVLLLSNSITLFLTISV